MKRTRTRRIDGARALLGVRARPVHILLLIASLLGLGPGSALAQGGPRPGFYVNPFCLEEAEEGLIDDFQAEWLCLGARSIGPYVCYDQARDRTLLNDTEAIELCRCAESAEPVRCFEAGSEGTLLDEDQIIEGCRPITKLRLSKTCLPYAGRSALAYPLPGRGP